MARESEMDSLLLRVSLTYFSFAMLNKLPVKVGTEMIRLSGES